MLRRWVRSTSGATLTDGLVECQRALRTTTLADTLKPIPGQSAGTLNVMNEVCVNPEGDEERKRPVFRSEVFPKKAEHHHLATIWKWGYNSLSLFKKINEDPGPWWNANCSTFTSNWAHIGDYGACGLWSGVWRYTYGIGQYNMRPGELRERGFGRREKSGAVKIVYNETYTAPAAVKLMPHTKEHQNHKRFKNPPIAGAVDIDPVHGKRVLREVQYHLGQGLRMYLVDGVFGSNPETCTPFRIITDNATHAYAASSAALRNGNIHCYEEVVLCKRLQQSPLDEWSWRRPGVLIYHAPCYDFEIPRIVEEFGGPRPSDLSLTTPKFVLMDPYSIPMKGVIGGDPSIRTLLDTVAFLSARWGYHADDRFLLTLPGCSFVDKAGNNLNVLVGAKATAESANLYSADYHRIGGGLISRGFDVHGMTKATTSLPVDIIEASTGTTFRPLPSAHNRPKAHSHRFYDRRHVGEFGYKLKHTWSTSPEDAAAASGMLFKRRGEAPVMRAAAHTVRACTFTFVTDQTAPLTPASAAELAAASLEQRNQLYADKKDLVEHFTKVFAQAKALNTVTSSALPGLVEKLSN